MFASKASSEMFYHEVTCFQNMKMGYQTKTRCLDPENFLGSGTISKEVFTNIIRKLRWGSAPFLDLHSR